MTIAGARAYHWSTDPITIAIWDPSGFYGNASVWGAMAASGGAVVAAPP